MKQANDALKTILDKCDILLENEIISKELLLQSFADFVLQTIDKEKHNVGIALHTGSICFDALMVIYSAVACMVYNESNVNDIIDSLNYGDSVLYGEKQRSRYTFEGITAHPSISKMKCIKLTQGKQSITYVPPQRWHLISPYNGSSNRYDGRGIRKKSGIREEFYKRVLDYKPADIPALADVSVVIVMNRERAEFLLDNLSLSFDDKLIKISELVCTSYFTENDEHILGGNASKNEANVKFCGKISVARNLILKRDGNRHLGIVICGSENVARGQTELPELLNRRSLQFVYVCMNYDSEFTSTIIEESGSPLLFVCSYEYLLCNSLPTKGNGQYCTELSRQVDAVLDRDIEPHILNGRFTWDDYKNVKRALLHIKKSDFICDEKEDFIIQAYSLINLFLTAIFKISVLEKCISDGKLEVLSPNAKINELKNISEDFPESLQKHVQIIMEFLETAYLCLEEGTEKEQYLRKLLMENSNKKIAIVVPKAYYAVLLRECGLYNLMDDETLLTIVTANRFNNATLYDHIIVIGNFSGKRFDVFKCRAAQRIETLLYDYEAHFFKYRLKSSKKAEQLLNSLCFSDNISEEVSDDEYKAELSETEIIEVAEIDNEIDEYISRINDIATFRNIGMVSSGGATPLTEIVAVGNFDSGEKVLFTKNYKAYVFDDDSGTVTETKVTELSEGDSLVFAQRNSETRDIVDSILCKLLDEDKFSAEVLECYNKSVLWKKKLVEYMVDNEYTAKEIALKMIQNGVQVQENTIKGWLDEDSHTVGPQKVDSIQQIALLIEDEEMLENANIYFEACSTIRKIRREILKQIGEAIINKLSGRLPQENSVAADIYERIDSIALILRMESIAFAERAVPMNLTNRPIIL